MSKTENHKKLLLISADSDLTTTLYEGLCLQGYELVVARSHSEALSRFDDDGADIVLIDLEQLPPQEMDLVSYIKTQSPETEIAVIATITQLDDATFALRNGASLYIIKPVSCKDIQAVLERLSLKVDQSRDFIALEQRVLNDLMGASETMRKMLRLATKIAPTTSTVLLGGESGTGKEFFAKIIHRMSQRTDGKFVAMNCGAIPDTLFESELFGHKKGSFTGADRDKPGMVEEAHLGTLFLDEVGELSPAAQVKLLRFLQERTFRRVGDNQNRTVNTRIIAATNRSLVNMVQNGTFREDLYYRLNVFYLHLPPLRERKETLPNLIRLFVHRQNNVLGKNINSISKGAEVILAGYNYPGNVRELENIIEHAAVLADGTEITEKNLPEFMLGHRLMLKAPLEDSANASTQESARPRIAPLEEIERNHIKFALDMLDYNYSETAKQLGVSRSTLWRKIKTYKLEKEDQ